MADDPTPTPDPTAPAAPPATGQPPETPTPPPIAEIPPEMKAALHKANEEAKTLRLKLKEIEDRDLSALDVAKRDAEEARSQLAEVQATALRQRIALEKGLPAEIAATLNGSTEEDLAAHADRLLAWRGEVPPTPPKSPLPDPSQGAHPTSPAAVEDAEYEQFFPTQPRS